MVLPFFNETGFIADVLVDISNNVTGSLFLTFLLIMIFIVLIGFLFRLPFEYTSILVLPLFLVFMAATGSFMAVGGVILIYLGVIIAKNFFLK